MTSTFSTIAKKVFKYKGVYYWDDSYHFDFSEDDMNTYFIADSFSDFLTLINERKNK